MQMRSSLSTPISDLESFYEHDRRVSTRFQSYRQINNGDDTIALLKLFVKYLSKQEVELRKILSQFTEIKHMAMYGRPLLMAYVQQPEVLGSYIFEFEVLYSELWKTLDRSFKVVV